MSAANPLELVPPWWREAVLVGLFGLAPVAAFAALGLGLQPPSPEHVLGSAMPAAREVLIATYRLGADRPWLAPATWTATLVVAAAGIYRLAARERLPSTASRTTWLFALAPTAAIVFVDLSAGLFLAASVWCLASARLGRLGAAAIFGLLAGGLRPGGFLLLVPVALDARHHVEGLSLRAALAVAAPLAGAATLLLDGVPASLADVGELLSVATWAAPTLSAPWNHLPAWFGAGVMGWAALALIAASVIALLSPVRGLRPSHRAAGALLALAALAQASPQTAVELVAPAFSFALAVGFSLERRPHWERPLLAAEIVALLVICWQLSLALDGR